MEKTVWVVVTDGHNLDTPVVNVCATEERALALVREMWDIWLGDNPADAAVGLPEPSPCYQGHVYAFEHVESYWENEEWHYVYEVEVSQ